MTKDIKVPGPDHTITVDSTASRVVARVGEVVIADTTAALTLREAGYPPVHYFPLADVVADRLRSTTSDSYCPYKGDASYYDIVLPDGDPVRDAVWTYRSPYPATAAIADHVAFYADRVQVTVEEA
jgi:uncharacterized protein (DUF427 family)